MRTALMLFLYATLFIACNKEHETEVTTLTGTFYCSDPHLLPSFPHYSYNKASSVICRTYYKDSIFDSLISEQTITLDSFEAADEVHNASHSFLLSPDYDHELILPMAADTYRISQITVIRKSETIQYLSSNKQPSNCRNDFRPIDIAVTCNGQTASYSLYEVADGYYYMYLIK